MTNLTFINSWKVWIVVVAHFIAIDCSIVQAQIEISFTTEANMNCNGTECVYDGPKILINEMVINPAAGDGAIWDEQGQGGEWVELYNPDICSSIDVSCFYIGNNAFDALAEDQANYPGGFVIPPGTVIPPAGFLLMHGGNFLEIAPELLVQNGGNTVELEIDGTGVCLGGGERLWLPNAGGWLAIYDNNGVPQDAVSWSAQNNIGNFPCSPVVEGCSLSGFLSNYNSIPDDLKSVIATETVTSNQSLRRMPDGESWSDFASSTFGYCNAECAEPEFTACNGTATVMASGTGGYSYLWNDAQGQTTATAVNLCAQEYCVVVTDTLGNSAEACITIAAHAYESEAYDSFCEGDDYQLTDGTVATESGLYELALQTEYGCDSVVSFELEMFPEYNFEFDHQICDDSSYLLPDGEEVNESGSYTVNFMTQNGCDSTYTINLTVEPVINITEEFDLCEGETHTLPDGTEVDTSGQYEVVISGGDCDSVFDVTLNVNPVYNLQFDAEICADENYTLPDGTVTNEGGLYNSELQTVSGCDSLIETFLIVHELPDLNITMDATFCFQPGKVPIQVNPEGGMLTFNDSQVTGDSLNLNEVSAGNHSIQYEFTNSMGCSSSVNHSLSILPIIDPAFSHTVSCLNVADFTNLTVDPTEDYQYLWQINDSTFSEGFSASYEYDDPGEYTITLTAVNDLDCAYSTTEIAELPEGLQLSEFWLPNVLTPNGDDANPVFLLMPESNECLKYNITIFNRWGMQVYEFSESGVPFTGRNQTGELLDEGIYFYLLESEQIDCKNDAYNDLCKGSVHLLR